MAKERRTKIKRPPRVEPAAWLTESIRLTMFPFGPLDPRPELWSSLTEHAPDSIREFPNQGIRQEQGGYKDAYLTVTQNRSRVDVILGPLPTGMPTPQEVVQIGNYSDRATAFSAMCKDIIRSSPALKRLAYAPIVVIPTDTIVEANTLIARFVPGLRVAPDRDTDIHLQINRGTISTVVDGLSLVRLRTWQSFYRPQITAMPGGQFVSTPAGAPLLRLDMDLSSAADHQNELPLEACLRLFDELVSTSDQVLLAGEEA